MQYISTSVATFGPGVALGLSKEQATARAHNLQPISGREGWYLTSAHVQFKRGEKFECDDVLPRSLANVLEALESPNTPESPALQKPADAKKNKVKAEVQTSAPASEGAKG